MVKIEVTIGQLKLPTAKAARAGLVGGMGSAMKAVEAQARLNASLPRNGPPGPRVQTGKLHSNIHGQVRDDGREVVGVLGTPVEYAPILEFGGHIEVRAHQRRITQAWGRKIAPRTVNVKAHDYNRKAYPFLRPAIASPFMQGNIARIIQHAVSKAINGG